MSSLKDPVDQFLVLLELDLLLPVLDHELFLFLLLQFHELILLPHILLGPLSHLLADLDVFGLLELAFDVSFLYLVSDLRAHVVGVGVHAGALFAGSSDFVDGQGAGYRVVFLNIKLLLVFEHLLQEGRLNTSIEINDLRLHLPRLLPFDLLVPVVLVRIQHLFLVHHF